MVARRGEEEKGVDEATTTSVVCDFLKVDKHLSAGSAGWFILMEVTAGFSEM